MSGRLKSQTRITWDHQHRWQCRNANASAGFLLRSTIYRIARIPKKCRKRKKESNICLTIDWKETSEFSDHGSHFSSLFFRVCTILNFIWNVFKKHNRGYNSIHVFFERVSSGPLCPNHGWFIMFESTSVDLSRTHTLVFKINRRRIPSRELL